MNRLFSKSEINALKDSIKKQKNSYAYNSIKSPMEKDKIHELNNLYNAVLSIEHNMKKVNKKRQ